jgi:predicted MPP superfamily phosphohydrolase
LRFSNAENILTVGAHLEIISSSKAVWWGWWRKEGELPSLDVLKKLQSEVRARQTPLRIGLLNRKGDESFHVAECVDLHYSDDGSPISAPEPDITPEYYRAQKCPAWFKFRWIDTIQRPDFEREFGAIPSLDSTLYQVFSTNESDPNSFEIRPGPNWTMAPTKTNGEAVLHISDLHFGESHGFVTERPQPELGISVRPLWEIISTRIRHDLGVPIGVVVVSGDLITKGKGESYADAQNFLDQLLAALRLGREHCVIVPGNHDMWTVDVDHPTRNYKHEQPYKTFLEGFFKTDFRTGLERVRRYRTPTGRDLIFIELNSSRIRSDALKQYGYVAKHRYEALLTFVAASLKQEKETTKPIFFAVIHHHLMPVGSVETIPDEKRPVSLCLDAGELIEEFQKFGIQFALHGHQHAPFIGTASRLPDAFKDGEYVPHLVYVIGSGSSGARREALPRNLEANTFGIYIPKDGNLDVTIEKYTEAVSPTPHCHVLLPIKQWVNPA